MSQILPKAELQSLNGSPLSLPSGNKPLLLVFTTHLGENQELSSWIDPLYQKFVAKSGMLDAFFDADLYVVLAPDEVSRKLAESRKEKLAAELPPDLAHKVLVLHQLRDEWSQALSPGRKHAIALVSKEGKILVKESGAYSDVKMEHIEDAFE